MYRITLLSAMYHTQGPAKGLFERSSWSFYMSRNGKPWLYCRQLRPPLT